MTTRRTSQLSPYWAEAFKPEPGDQKRDSEAIRAAGRRKSLMYRGSGNPNARFTDDQRRAVAEEARRPGANVHAIARKHGFSKSYVFNLKHGTRGSV